LACFLTFLGWNISSSNGFMPFTCCFTASTSYKSIAFCSTSDRWSCSDGTLGRFTVFWGFVKVWASSFCKLAASCLQFTSWRFVEAASTLTNSLTSSCAFISWYIPLVKSN
jgi:hypothetical protein